LWLFNRYRLGREKSPEGQKSSDEEDETSSHAADRCKKATKLPASESQTGRASSSSTPSKNAAASSCGTKTGFDKLKDDTSMTSDVKEKKDVDDSQLTDEGACSGSFKLI